MSARNAARAGDRLVVVTCHGGPVYVRASMRSEWRCFKCGGAGTGNVVVVLGEPGEPIGPAPALFDGEAL